MTQDQLAAVEERSWTTGAQAASAPSSSSAQDWLPTTGARGAQLKRYIAGDMRSVTGYLHPVDAAAIAALLSIQSGNGIRGGAAEIGVFYGRSAFLIAKALEPQERFFAIDLFDCEPLVDGEPGQLKSFKRSAERLGVDLSHTTIHVGPSEQVSAQTILNTVGPVRFFSVDGGHLEEHVRYDSALALATLSDDGVIAFDDFFNPEWPGVTIGVLDFLRANSGAVTPFAITKDKLFVCRRGRERFYADALRGSPWIRGFRPSPVDMLGTEVLRLHHDTMQRVIYHGLEKLGLGGLAYSWQANQH
jgi:hypothetical protein